MLDTSARLLRLLSLLQARRFWTGGDLADRLEVTERTVRRDVDRLRSLGYPVESSTGVAGGYQLGAGAALPPLQLDDEEALAVALGLRTAAMGTVSGMEEAAVRVLAKLERVLPLRLRRRMEAFHASVALLPFAGPHVDPQVLTACSMACRDRESLTFCYSDGQGRTSERRVDPHGLVHTGRRWYLAAWDLGRGDWRTFRVDRVLGGVSPGQRFTPRPIPEGSAAAYVSRSVSSSHYPFQARVVLHAPHAWVAERVPPLAARLQPIDDQRCRLEAGSHDIFRLALHIGLVGVAFDVEEPPELLDAVRLLAVRFAEAGKLTPPKTAQPGSATTEGEGA